VSTRKELDKYSRGRRCGAGAGIGRYLPSAGGCVCGGYNTGIIENYFLFLLIFNFQIIF
jgi:hypothetical protein